MSNPKNCVHDNWIYDNVVYLPSELWHGNLSGAVWKPETSSDRFQDRFNAKKIMSIAYISITKHRHKFRECTRYLRSYSTRIKEPYRNLNIATKPNHNKITLNAITYLCDPKMNWFPTFQLQTVSNLHVGKSCSWRNLIVYSGAFLVMYKLNVTVSSEILYVGTAGRVQYEKSLLIFVINIVKSSSFTCNNKIVRENVQIQDAIITSEFRTQVRRLGRSATFRHNRYSTRPRHVTPAWHEVTLVWHDAFWNRVTLAWHRVTLAWHDFQTAECWLAYLCASHGYIDIEIELSVPEKGHI